MLKSCDLAKFGDSSSLFLGAFGFSLWKAMLSLGEFGFQSSTCHLALACHMARSSPPVLACRGAGGSPVGKRPPLTGLSFHQIPYFVLNSFDQIKEVPLYS